MQRIMISMIVLAVVSASVAHSQDLAASEEARAKLSQAVEKDRRELTGSVQDLVRIKSIKGDPQPGAPFGQGPAHALVKALNIATELGFNATNMDGYIGYAEYGQGESYVGVLAHLDVVPEGDGWTYPPYAAEIHQGRIYGRGAVDDKGPAMASLYGLKALKDSGLPISKRVRIIFGTTEETGIDDVVYYLQHEKTPVAGFTPDSHFPVVYAEKGSANFRLIQDLTNMSAGIRVLSIQGGTASNSVPDEASAEISTGDTVHLIKSCQSFASSTGYQLTAEEKGGNVLVNSKGLGAHGSEPEKGKNAAMQLLAFLGTLGLGKSDLAKAIEFFNSRVGMETDGKSFGVAMRDNISGNLTFNVGKINATLDKIVFDLNLRYPVTYKLDDIMKPFNRTIAGTGFSLEVTRNQNPLYFPMDSLLVRTLLKVYNDQTGQNGKPLAVGGRTYASLMPNMVGFGPIFPNQPMREHKPDEYISVDEMVLIDKIYAQAIYELAK
jgi:succinyl-diaminopimelate desuccinylase